MCIDIPTHLPCIGCGKMLPIDQFHNKASNKGRYQKQSSCISCCKEALRKWRVENPLRSTLQTARIAFKTRNVPEGFDLDVDYLKPLDVDICPILGIPMQWNTGANYGKAETEGVKARGTLWQQANSKSLDRIHCTKGYLKGNVLIVSWRANKLKGDATLEELIKMGEWAKQQLLYETTH